MKKLFVLSVAMVAMLGLAQGAQASGVICTEDPIAGCFTDLFVGTPFAGFGYLVGSDGEGPYDPLGLGFSYSDALDFSRVGLGWHLVGGAGWVDLGGGRAIALEGIEGPGEFSSPAPWTGGALGTYLILGDGGRISDTIILTNDAAGAHLTFISDTDVPEPSTLGLLAAGLLGGIAALRKRLA